MLFVDEENNDFIIGIVEFINEQESSLLVVQKDRESKLVVPTSKIKKFGGYI